MPCHHFSRTHHSQVVQPITAVEHHALDGHRLGQVLDCLGLSCEDGKRGNQALRVKTLHAAGEVECTKDFPQPCHEPSMCIEQDQPQHSDKKTVAWTNKRGRMGALMSKRKQREVMTSKWGH